MKLRFHSIDAGARYVILDLEHLKLFMENNKDDAKDPQSERWYSAPLDLGCVNKVLYCRGFCWNLQDMLLDFRYTMLGGMLYIGTRTTGGESELLCTYNFHNKLCTVYNHKIEMHHTDLKQFLRMAMLS